MEHTIIDNPIWWSSYRPCVHQGVALITSLKYHVKNASAIFEGKKVKSDAVKLQRIWVQEML